MSKKKSTIKNKKSEVLNNPFRQLKGFAVSAAESAKPAEPVAPGVPVTPGPEPECSFYAEMDFLGVDPLEHDREIVDPMRQDEPDAVQDSNQSPVPAQTEEECFLAALGPLDVRFVDELPTPAKPASPRRLKQLRQGRITPDAELDLHGLQRHQVAGKIENFLQNARFQQWQTLIVVTGRGLHSADGQTALRDEAERFLADEGRRWVAEWCRAPRQFGGDGALVIFMKKTDAGDL
jgi:DNA-nicking Smr family endonuclease